MRILLDQDEIQQALETFVKTMGIEGATGIELTVNGDEIQAEILMHSISSPRVTAVSTDNETANTDQPRRRGGRVPGSKNKPKVNTDVATTAEAGDDLNGSGTAEAGEDEGSDDETEATEAVAKSTRVSGVRTSLFDSDDEADGTKPSQPASGGIFRGNPSGASENESSETSDPDASEGSDTETETEAALVRTTGKRPSIFDAD